MCSVQSVFYSLDSFFVVGFGHATVRCDNHQVQYDTNQNGVGSRQPHHQLQPIVPQVLCVCGTSRVLLNQLEDIVGWVQAVALGTLPTVQP
eukprot:m.451720 g.451720  ORF g.451720 m.451720 type:complete len:91 (+) comp20195_c0_seq1:28-300(+)